MKKKKLVFLLIFILLSAFFSALAEANGTVTVTFKNRDASGVETPLSYAYIYLRPASELPPKEIYFRDATYVLGPSNANGTISVSVPEGTYYVRITSRNPSGTSVLGPPRPADYTWHQTDPITIITNTVTNLGTQYARPFGTVMPSMSISGKVTNYLGNPAPGKYVRAQPVQCILADYSSSNPAEWVDSNHCGPDKYLAFGRTDANGNYILYLKYPGIYFIYGSSCLGDRHQSWLGNPCVGTQAPATITVRSGDNKILNFWINQ